MNRISIQLALCFSLLSCCYGQVGTRECAMDYPFNYIPKEVLELDDFPPNISDSISTYMITNFGADFYKLLTYSRGLHINYKELLERDEIVKNFEWTVPTYVLAFSLSVEYAGILEYCSVLTLDSLGRVLQPLEFPTTENQRSTSFMRQRELFEIAQSNGFETAKYTLEFRDNHIVLAFVHVKKPDYTEFLEISVHTGEIITRRRTKGIVKW